MCVSPGNPPPIPWVAVITYIHHNLLFILNVSFRINPQAQCGPTSSNKSECPLKVCCRCVTDPCCTVYMYLDTSALVVADSVVLHRIFARPIALLVHGIISFSFTRTVVFNLPSESNCIQPTLPSCSGSATRKITYYAGWGSRRPCSSVSPSDVSPQLYIMKSSSANLLRSTSRDTRTLTLHLPPSLKD